MSVVPDDLATARETTWSRGWRPPPLAWCRGSAIVTTGRTLAPEREDSMQMDPGGIGRAPSPETLKFVGEHLRAAYLASLGPLAGWATDTTSRYVEVTSVAYPVLGRAPDHPGQEVHAKQVGAELGRRVINTVLCGHPEAPEDDGVLGAPGVYTSNPRDPIDPREPDDLEAELFRAWVEIRGVGEERPVIAASGEAVLDLNKRYEGKLTRRRRLDRDLDGFDLVRVPGLGLDEAYLINPHAVEVLEVESSEYPEEDSGSFLQPAGGAPANVNGRVVLPFGTRVAGNAKFVDAVACIELEQP